VALWAAAIAVSVPGLANLRVETSTDSVLDTDAPSWAEYQAAVEIFGSDEIVVLANPLDEPVGSESAAVLADVAERLEQNTYVRRVDGLSTIGSPRRGPDGSLVLDPVWNSKERFLDRAALENDRVIPGAVLARDGLTDSVVVRVSGVGAEVDTAVVTAVRRAANAHGLAITGGPVFRVETNERTRSEVIRLGAPTGIVIGVLLFAFFLSLRLVGSALLVAGTTVLLTLGAMGFLDVPLSITTFILPTVLVALAASHSVHVYSSMIARGGALEREVVRAVGLSGATTAIGFCAMALTRLDVIDEVGLFGAIGSLIGMVCALTLVPATSPVVPRRRSRLGDYVGKVLVPSVVRLATARPAVTLGVWLAAAAVAFTGLARLEVETDVVQYFKPSSAIRSDYELIRSRLAGISPMSVVVANSQDGVATPKGVEFVGDLQRALERHPDVGSVVSFVDPLIQIRSAINGSESVGDQFSSYEIEQYMLLLSGVDFVSDLISADGRSAQIMIRSNNNGSDDLLLLAEYISDWARERAPDGYNVQVTGIMHEYASSEDAISDGQLIGMVVASLVILVALAFAFRDVGLAILAMIPNLVPVVFGFGAMGLIGVPLDAGTILVGTLALGIAVDDTVHMIFAHTDRPGDESLDDAIGRVGIAVVCTTALIVAGFSLLATSDFVLIRNLGMVTSSVMLACLFADATLLPALLTYRARGAS